MFGYIGKILRINLASRKNSIEPIREEWCRHFLGGRGMGTRIYMDEAPPGVDPLSEHNSIVVMTGPMVGTGALSGASSYIVTQSSLTGTIACAKTRGHFGAELKFAGYDGIVIEGAAESPVVLCLMDNKVFLQPALHLWGRTSTDAERVFKSELKDDWAARETAMVIIGPAGEKRFPVSTITSDGFLSVGGAGIGAVFGAKNLKGIAVKGQHSIRVADGNRLVQVVTTMINKMNGSPITSELMPQWGTAFLVRLANEKGMLPRDNFQTSSIENVKRLGTESIANAFALRSRGCFSCPMACLKKTDLKHAIFKGRGIAPTYKAIGALGTNCGVIDLEAIGRANMLCAEMGLDPVAAGGLLATIMELTQRGAMPTRDLKVELRFNDPDSLFRGLELISTNEGYASRLGAGQLLARTCGAPQFFMGVKGLPLSPFDPRAIQGLGLHFATSNQGPNHTYGYTIIDELLNVHRNIDPWETAGKPELVMEWQDTCAVMDSLGLCNWILMGLKFNNVVPMVNAVLGTQYKADDLLKTGERIWNLERLFNLRAGLTAEDDVLPERFVKEPISHGPAQGQVSKVPEMLPNYYELRGWSEKGVPRQATLERLRLEEFQHAQNQDRPR